MSGLHAGQRLQRLLRVAGSYWHEALEDEHTKRHAELVDTLCRNAIQRWGRFGEAGVQNGSRPDEALVASDPRLQRLIHVAGSYWHWAAENQSAANHRKLLDALLDSSGGGKAWFARAAAHHDRLPNPERHEESIIWFSHDDGRTPSEISTLAADLDNAGYERLISPNDASWRSSFAAARHRIFVDRERFEVVLGKTAGPAADFDVCLDFRYLEAANRMVCYLSMSIWSHSPWSSQHRPHSADLEIRRPSSENAFDCVAVAKRFDQIRTKTEESLRENFGVKPATLRIFERAYRPPVFWIAVPEHLEEDPVRYVNESSGRLSIPHVSAALLGSPGIERDCTVASSVFNDEVLVLRRFVGAMDGDVPNYLLLPALPPNTPVIPDWPKVFDAQEYRLSWMISVLCDLELKTATEIWDIQTDLEMWNNHLEAYGRAIERGGVLWDAMATHLLRHRGRALARVHENIELIHQTLLQGISDVGSVATAVDNCKSRLTEIGGNIGDVFADKVPEFHSGSVGLCTALSEHGHLAEMRARLEIVTQRAARVIQNYRDLLQAITEAFDERRVRETDSLQRAAAVLATVLALVGLVTVADTTVELQAKLVPAPTIWLLRSLTWCVGLLVLIAVGRFVARSFRLGRLGGRDYQRTYDGTLRGLVTYFRSGRSPSEFTAGLWDFLRLCSTGRLDEFDRALAQGAPRLATQAVDLPSAVRLIQDDSARLAAEWDALDAALARKFSDVWDQISALPGDCRVSREGGVEQESVYRSGLVANGFSPRAISVYRLGQWLQHRPRRVAEDDLRQISLMIDKWSLRTLIVTERPREMWHYELPRLTLLYRASLQLLGDSQSEVSVAFSDLYFLFGDPLHGLTWEEVEELDTWLSRQIRDLRDASERGSFGGDSGIARGRAQPETRERSVSAKLLLARVERLDLAVGMAGYEQSRRSRFRASIQPPKEQEFDPIENSSHCAPKVPTGVLRAGVSAVDGKAGSLAGADR